MDLERATDKSWFVRTAEGAVYGPATFVELLGWAAEARIVPGSVISDDNLQWTAAEQVPELGLEWYADLGDGEKIGPLHLYAICDLVGDGSIRAGTMITNPTRSITVAADDALFKLVAETARRELAAFAVSATSWGREALERTASAAQGRAEHERQRPAVQIPIVKQDVRHAVDPSLGNKAVDEIRAHAELEIAALNARIVEMEKESRRLQEMLAGARAALDLETSSNVQERERFKIRQAGLIVELEAVRQRLVSEQALREEQSTRLIQAERDAQRLGDEIVVRDNQLRIAHEQAAEARRKTETRLSELQEQINGQEARHAAELALKNKAGDEIKARVELGTATLNTRIVEMEKESRQLQEALAGARAALDQAVVAHAHDRERLEIRQAGLINELEAVKQRLVSEQPLLEEKSTRLLQAERDAQRLGDELRVRDKQLRITHEQIEEARRKEAAILSETEFLRQTLAQREAQLQEQETARESGIADARKSITDLQTKMTAQRKAAEEESKQARDTIENLQREIVRLQKECAGTAAMLSRSMEELESHAGKRQHPTHIDWIMVGNPGGQDPSAPVPRATAPTHPGTPEKTADLQEQIQKITALYGRSEQQLTEQKDLYDASCREHRDREKLLNALIDQLKRDMEASARVVQQTMQEIERREMEFRNQRRQGEQREAELRGRIVELERLVSESAGRAVPSEHVVPEVLPPVSRADEAEIAARSNEPANILAGLEAQAQAEIDAWHRNEARDPETGPAVRIKNWLKRKQQ